MLRALRQKGIVFSMAAAAFVIVLPSMANEENPDQQWKAPDSAARKKNPIYADENSIAAGRAVYANECRSCHGESGKGDGPATKKLGRKAADLSNPRMSEQTDGALFWKISEGRKPMPRFEKTLSEDERWQVINYVRTLGPKSPSK